MEQSSESASKDKKYTFLILDDDVVFGKKLAEAIERKGYACHHASTIKEAFHILSTQPIDRIILDLKLNNENGLSLLEYLNNKNKINTIKVCILTGFGSVETVRHALFRGATNYLQKPCSVDSILESFENKYVDNYYPTPTLEDIEKEHINRVIIEQNGNISQSAKILGLHRRSLQRKLKK